MKTKVISIAILTILGFFGKQSLNAQGTFKNLNFENPIPPLTGTGGLVPIVNALPGWAGYLNGSPTDWVSYPDVAIGSPSISLVSLLSAVYQPIQGNYSVFLQVAAIGQTGQIPNGSMSLTFLREPGSGFLVSFAGQNIPLVQYGTSGSNIIMAGDISAFAGRTGELVFSGGGLFDAIQFSPQPIPEPTSIALVILGVTLLGIRRCKRLNV